MNLMPLVSQAQARLKHKHSPTSWTVDGNYMYPTHPAKNLIYPVLEVGAALPDEFLIEWFRKWWAGECCINYLNDYCLVKFFQWCDFCQGFEGFEKCSLYCYWCRECKQVMCHTCRSLAKHSNENTCKLHDIVEFHVARECDLCHIDCIWVEYSTQHQGKDIDLCVLCASTDDGQKFIEQHALIKHPDDHQWWNVFMFEIGNLTDWVPILAENNRGESVTAWDEEPVTFLCVNANVDSHLYGKPCFVHMDDEGVWGWRVVDDASVEDLIEQRRTISYQEEDDNYQGLLKQMSDRGYYTYYAK